MFWEFYSYRTDHNWKSHPKPSHALPRWRSVHMAYSWNTSSTWHICGLLIINQCAAPHLKYSHDSSMWRAHLESIPRMPCFRLVWCFFMAHQLITTYLGSSMALQCVMAPLCHPHGTPIFAAYLLSSMVCLCDAEYLGFCHGSPIWRGTLVVFLWRIWRLAMCFDMPGVLSWLSSVSGHLGSFHGTKVCHGTLVEKQRSNK